MPDKFSADVLLGALRPTDNEQKKPQKKVSHRGVSETSE
jgi:hypothetical protein